MSVEKLIVDHMETWTSALQTRSTAGRGSSGKIDLYGIKKLRELILELAVRGKLVPQDPNDEPASELLKRIAAEKAELVKQGKIKKQKPLPEISEEEKPFELPEGWEWVRLGDFTNIIRGITFPGNEKSQFQAPGKIACLRTANVQEQIDWDDLIYISDSFVKRDDQYLQEHDIVMSMANSRELVGKVALASLPDNSKFTFGGFLSVLRPLVVNEIYLMALLRCETYKSQLIESASQTTNIANISLAKLNPLPVCIPPAKEQIHIVKKMNELMSLCDQLEQQSLTSLDAHQQLVETLLGTLTHSQNAEELAENWARISEHFDTLFTTEASVEEFTIEHIMPQNENLSAKWREELGSDWQRIHKELLHTLGNLTLTRYNSRYSDRPFAEKRDIEDGFKHSPLYLNIGLGQCEKWDEAAIRARADRLADLAVQVWQAPALPEEVLAVYRAQPENKTSYSLSDYPFLADGSHSRVLFDHLRDEVMRLDAGITQEVLKLYIAFKAETNFVDVVPQKSRLRLSLNMQFHELVDPKGIAKDVTNVGRWGNGDVEIGFSDLAQLPYIMGLIRQAFEKQMESALV